MIQTQKQKIKNFLNDVNVSIYEIIEKKYYNKKDFEEIESFEDELIKKIYKVLLDFVENNKGITWSSFCPWCIKQILLSNGGCNKCSFAGRHNLCMSENSDWHIMSKKLKEKDPKNNINKIVKFKLFKNIIPIINKKDVRDIINNYTFPEKNK